MPPGGAAGARTARQFGPVPASAVFGTGVAVAEATLAENVSGVPGGVADLALQLADGLAHGLPVGAARVAPHRLRRASQVVTPPASSERVCGSLYSMAVSGTARPVTVTRWVARSIANHYAAGENFHMTASLTPKCLRETRRGSAGIVSGT